MRVRKERLKGDKKVKEAEARASVDILTKGVVDLQKQAGAIVPDVRKAEDFAQKITAETIARHEDQASRPELPMAPKPPAAPPDRLSRGDVGENTIAINRPVEDAPPKKQVQEDPLLRARLDFLSDYPEWLVRLWKAVQDGEKYARNLGCKTYEERAPIVADFVINVAEQSNAVFGDWRFPKPTNVNKIIVSG